MLQDGQDGVDKELYRILNTFIIREKAEISEE